MNQDRRATFEIGEETETAQGWAYELTRHHRDGSISTHTLGLCWADHELISGGIFAPSETVKAVCRFLDKAEKSDAKDLTNLPARFDVSTLRRLLNDFDSGVRSFVGHESSDR